VATQEHGPASADPDKSARIAVVVDEVMQRLDLGNTVDFTEIEHSHSDLMPELREFLRDLEELLSARNKARDDRPASAPRAAWLEEDLAFLRRWLDKYEVLGRVRHGGQGVVYKAQQKGANRLVAIKVLLDGPLATDRQRQRFEREIELISRLSHPNIVTLHDTGIIRGRHYFTMEYVEGLPIDDYTVFHDLTPRQIVRLFITVCQAVSYAHQNGVIHRDLSPANILVDEQGRPHVFDFGLAKDVWESVGAAGASLTGQFVGTWPYVSPEQAGGLDGKVDVRSDVYTLGIVLYELLADGLPYDVHGEPAEVRHAILNSAAQPLRKAVKAGDRDWIRELNTVNRDLEEILTKALAKEKEARYQSVAAFAEDLERCLAGAAISARADNRFYLLRKAVRRYRVAVAVAATIMLTVGVSWLQVRAQRDTARQAAREAFDLFEDSYDVEEIVRGLPGGVAVRDDLIRRLSDRLPTLESLSENDAGLAPIRLRLLEKQGDIAAQQGQREQAAGYFKEFLEGGQRLAEGEPDNDAYHDAVARAYRQYAGVSDDPGPLYEEGIRYADEVLRKNPQRQEARYDLAEIRHAFGKYLLDSGAFGDALPQFDAALGLCPRDDPRAEEHWAQLQAVALDRRAQVLAKLGRAGEGLADLQASLRIRERIAEVNPTDTVVRHDLLTAYEAVASAQRDAGNVAGAEQPLRKAIAIGELLRRMDPSAVDSVFSLYGAYDRLSRLLLETDVPEAAELAEHAFTLAQQLAARGGQPERCQSTLGWAYMHVGYVRLREDTPDLAYRAFQQAVTIRASLLESDPENLTLRGDLATAYGRLAEAARKLGRLREAAEHHGTALTIRRALYAEHPEVVEYALDMANSGNGVAAAHLEAKTEADDAIAKPLLDEMEQLLEQLRAAGKFVGQESRLEKRLTFIRNNQALLQERAAERRASAAAALTSQDPG